MITKQNKNIPIIDATGFTFGLTADYKLGLRIRSAKNPELEIRFPLEAVKPLLKALQQAVDKYTTEH